jgi:hypothetical protein
VRLKMTRRNRVRARAAVATVASLAVLGVSVGVAAPASAAPSESVLDQLIPSGQPNPVDEIEKLISPSGDPSRKPNLLNSRPTKPNATGLNVTVGRAVVVSSLADGSSAGLTALISKTQVSGDGSRVIQVPMATANPSNSDSFSALNVQDDAVVYDVANTAPSVQTFNAGNSSYDGELPVTVAVRTWVDDQEIDPTEMINVTGNVKVEYKFRNETGVKTPLTFKNARDQVVTEYEDIPVPFGGSFSVTLPPSFADVNAPWATGAMSPSGLVMSGSVNLLGPIPVIGGIEQTLTLTARAEKATLPAATYQAVPVALSTTEADLALKGGPVAAELAQIGANGVKLADDELLKYHALFTKYVAAAEDINDTYVRPILRGFKDGTYQKMLDDGLAQVEELDSGAQQLGQLLPVSTEVISYLDTAMKTGVPLVEENLDTINDVIAQYEKYLPQIAAIVPQLKQTLKWLDDNVEGYLAQGEDLAKTAKTVCNSVQGIDDNIDSLFAWLESTVKPWVPTGVWDVLMSYIQPIIDKFNTIETYVDSCVEYAPIVIDSLKTAQEQLPTYLGYAESALTILKRVVALAQEYNPYVEDFVKNQDKYLKMLDNNKCPKTPEGISKCGYKQQINFLYGLMQQATSAVQNDMVPGLDKVVEEYLPLVRKYYKTAQDNVNKYGPQAEALLPTVIDYVESTFGSLEGYTGKAAGYVDDAGMLIGRTVAAMEAMEVRGQEGQGQPAGANAVGADTSLAVYQFSMAPAADPASENLRMLAIALISALIALGMGTYLHRRNNRLGR